MANEIFDEATRQADAASNASAPDNNNPIIWLRGSGAAYSGGTPTSFAGYTQGVKQQASLTQIQDQVLAWDGARSPQFSTLAKKMVAGGFVSKSYADNGYSVANAMVYPVKIYSAYSAAGGSLSFDDWLDWYSSTGEGDGGRYTGPVTTVTTSITDPTTAEALLDKFSRDLLGRGLTQKETQRYLRDFRQAEQESPQVTTSTPQGPARRETVTESAASKEELLRQMMAKNPDYEKFQIDTTIVDMLMDDIKRGQEVLRG